jgi:glycolate oxidase FAD binding subunit
MQAGGSEVVMQRYMRELAGAEVREDDSLWTRVREFTPDWLREYRDGAVVRLSTTLQGVSDAIGRATGPAIARAGNGVTYVYYSEAAHAKVDGAKGAVEFSPESVKRSLTLWPEPGSDFPVMQRVKHLFDPKLLLNRGRLYGRI